MSWSGETELQNILNTITKPSQSKILAVSEFAITNARHYKQVVHLIERFIRKSNQEQQQFAGLYMIDAVCKASLKKLGSKDRKGDVYTPRFAQNLAEICLFVIEAQGSEGRRIVNKLCKTWRENKSFDSELIDKLADECAPTNSDDEDDSSNARPAPSKKDEPETKRRRVDTSVNDPRRKPAPLQPEHHQPPPQIPSPNHHQAPPAQYQAPPAYHHPQAPTTPVNHVDHQQQQQQYNQPPNGWQQPQHPHHLSPGGHHMMPMPPMQHHNQSPTSANLPMPPMHQPPPQPPAPVMPPPSLSAAFADDYSDEDDENEEARAERMRQRIEEQKAKLANK